MDAPNTRRIVLFGKTGAGKSSLANTFFGEELFLINHTLNSETTQCQARTKSINGRSITLIDNPGLFDPGRSEEDMKTDILRCVIECAPGPHAFLIVLKVEKFTEQEKTVVTQMCECFSKDALTYAAVVFTHGDQLPEGMKLEEFVNQSKGLSDLVKKCSGRCHVVDNKYWKNDQEDEYRSNQFQVEELLNTIEVIVVENKGGYYTNKMLQAVEEEIQKEEVRIRQSSGNTPQEEIREQARSNVLKKQMNNRPRRWIRYFVGGAVITAIVAIVSAVLIKSKLTKVTTESPLVKEDLTAISAIAAAGEKVPEIIVSTLADVIEEADQEPITPVKAIQNTFKAIMDKLIALYERTYNPWNPFE